MFAIRIAPVLFLVTAVEPAPVQDPPVIELQLDVQRMLMNTNFYAGLASGLVGLVPTGGSAEDLLLARVSPPGGVGDDATLRAFVARFLAEESPRHLFLLAHHLRLQTTRRWGTIWTIAGEPIAQLEACAASDSNPVRRAFALIALQDRHGFRSTPYLLDEAPLMRLAAARVLGAPEGVTEADALQVIEPLLALLADPRPAYRTAAAGALGPWIYRVADLERLVAVADSDPDPAVRAAALDSLGAVHSLQARERLSAVLADEASGAIERQSARSGLVRTGIIP